MERIEDVRLLDAIRRSPRRVLNHYTRTLGIGPEQGLQSIERLIQSGHVQRHRHSEKLSIPDVVEPPQPRRPGAFSARVGTPDPDVAPAATAPDKATVEGPVSTTDDGSYVPTLTSAQLPLVLVLTDLHLSILSELFSAGDAMTTTSLAATLDRRPQGLGVSLNTLAQHGLIESEGEVGKKSWQLTESGRIRHLTTPPRKASDHTAKRAESKCLNSPSHWAPVDTSSKADHAWSKFQSILDPTDPAAAPGLHYEPLTDEQMDEFRRLPTSFNGMMQAVHRAGFDAACQQPAPQWQEVLRKFDDIGELIQRCASGAEAH